MSIKLSVIIPCYNHGKFLTQALNSIFSYENQSEIEILVINDGSDDLYTIEFLEKLTYKNVIVVNKENQGLAKTRNLGISLAKGDLILTLDSDNYIDSIYIKEAIQVLELNKSVDIVYSDMMIFKDGINDCFKRKVVDVNLKGILLGETIDACAIFRKSTWELLGGYDECMPVMGLEDWDFWIRALEKEIKFYHIDKALFYYRDIPESMIKNTKKKQQIILQYIIKKHAHLYASYILEIGKELSYINRKPFMYLLKLLYRKWF